MALPIRVNFENPFIDIHTGRGQGSCTFANGFDCICSCAGIAHAQLLRMVLTPENSKKLPDKYKKALADKIQTVQAHIVLREMNTLNLGNGSTPLTQSFHPRRIFGRETDQEKEV